MSNDIVPSGKQDNTAIIPTPAKLPAVHKNTEDPDFLLVGEVIEDAEVIKETKKKKAC